jgi:hypothetical protein
MAAVESGGSRVRPPVVGNHDWAAITASNVRPAGSQALERRLVGGAHLLFADRDPGPPAAAAVQKLVTTVLAAALPRDSG